MNMNDRSLRWMRERGYYLQLFIFSARTPACDRQTDGRTDGHRPHRIYFTSLCVSL